MQVLAPSIIFFNFGMFWGTLIAISALFRFKPSYQPKYVLLFYSMAAQTYSGPGKHL